MGARILYGQELDGTIQIKANELQKANNRP